MCWFSGYLVVGDVPSTRKDKSKHMATNHCTCGRQTCEILVQDVHAHTSMCVSMYVCVCMCQAWLQACMHTCTCACIHECTHSNSHTHGRGDYARRSDEPEGKDESLKGQSWGLRGEGKGSEGMLLYYPPRLVAIA